MIKILLPGAASIRSRFYRPKYLDSPAALSSAPTFLFEVRANFCKVEIIRPMLE
jgi:hypothetical protein